MKDAYTAISLLHTFVDNWQWRAFRNGGLFDEIDIALSRDELGAHPDNVPDLKLAMMLDAAVLRRMADTIDIRWARLERDAAEYLAAAE